MSPEIDRNVGRFYSEIVGPYWPPERRLVEDRYRTLPFPFDEINAPELVIEEQWDLEQVLGYVNTWSAVRKATQALGHSPMPALAEEVALQWGEPSMRRTVRWPLTIRCAYVRRANGRRPGSARACE